MRDKGEADVAKYERRGDVSLKKAAGGVLLKKATRYEWRGDVLVK
jgi:hypothetical protein